MASFGAVTAGSAIPGPSGTGVLATATLTSQAAGESPLGLQGVVVLDTSAGHKTTILQETASPATYQIKVHPELNAGSRTGDTKIFAAYIKNDKWTRFTDAWSAKNFGTWSDADDQLLRNAKGGAFAYYNHDAKFGMQVNYNPDEVEYPRLWWLARWRQANLELITPRVELKQGESFSYSYQLEYLTDAPLD